MAPSAVITAKTALVEPSGERPRKAVPTAPVLRAPGMSCAGMRGVRFPAYTPPSNGSGAPARGSPVGSSIVDDPMPSRPYGAFTGQMRPKALLIESPSGLLTPVYRAVAAPGL